MIKHDLTSWPVVITVAEGETSPDEHMRFFADWQTWLERDQPFVTLRVFRDLASLRRPDGGAREAKAWLQRNGEAIRRLVVAMATVVPHEAVADVSKMDAERLFRVRARVFSCEREASAWVLDLLNAWNGDGMRDVDPVGGLIARLGSLRD